MPPMGRNGATIMGAEMETAGLQFGRKDAPHPMGFGGHNYVGFIKFLEEQCGKPLD